MYVSSYLYTLLNGKHHATIVVKVCALVIVGMSFHA